MTETNADTSVVEMTESNITSKSDLTGWVAARGNFTKSESTRAVEHFLSGIMDNVKDGREVQIQKFGTFTPAIQKAYTARNPSTGEPVEVPEKKTLRFKPSKTFKNFVNGEATDDNEVVE